MTDTKQTTTEQDFDERLLSMAGQDDDKTGLTDEDAEANLDDEDLDDDDDSDEDEDEDESN